MQHQLYLFQNVSNKLSDYFDNATLLNINNKEELHQKLSQAIVYLLLNEMEKLLQILYRIDINETKIKEAFAQYQPDLIAPRLAKLVIDR